MKSLRRVLASAATAAGLLFAGLAVAAPANASVPANAGALPVAYNQGTQFLTDNPSLGMASTCVSRPIFLTLSDYQWLPFTSPSASWINPGVGNGRNIELKSANYTWRDCLIPHDGFYVEQSTLSGPWGSAVTSSSFQLRASGTYTWGTLLIPG
jgi:hypothetical protein